MLRFRIVLALTLALAAVPATASADVKSDLTKAETAYSNLDLSTATSLAQRLIQTGKLSHTDLVRATRVLALSSAAQDHAAEAKDAYVLLLAYDPTFTVDPKLGPRYRSPFSEAKGYWSAQSVKPGADVTAVIHGRGASTLRVTTRDPSNIVRRVVVSWRWAPQKDFVERVVNGGDVAVDITLPPNDATRLDFFATAEDAAGNIVFEAGNAGVPRSANVPLATKGSAGSEKKGLLKSPWFWIVGSAAVIGGGVATALALTQGGSSTTYWRPALTCGGARCE